MNQMTNLTEVMESDMAKRFTDTEMWGKKWYRSLSIIDKLLWRYITDNCDNCGVYAIDEDKAEFEIGQEINWELATESLKKQIHVFDNGEKWWIKDFMGFHIKNTNRMDNLKKQAMKLLEKHGLLEEYHNHYNIDPTLDLDEVNGRPNVDLDEVNIRDTVNVNVNVKETKKEDIKGGIVKGGKPQMYKSFADEFEKARKLYPGTKRGHRTEYDNFYKKYKKELPEIILMLVPAIESQITARKLRDDAGEFVPEWKNFQTWINQRNWEIEMQAPARSKDQRANIPQVPRVETTKIDCPICDKETDFVWNPQKRYWLCTECKEHKEEAGEVNLKDVLSSFAESITVK